MIALCINCGWLGEDKDLGVMPIRSDIFKTIIEVNNMHMKACPQCRNAEICYKTELDNLYSPVIDDPVIDADELTNKIEKLVDKYPDTEEEYDPKLVDDILDYASRPRKPLDKQDCDICKKEFEAKFETSRCDECYDKLMKRVEKDIEKEKKNKKTKKKVNKKAKKKAKPKKKLNRIKVPRRA